MNTIDWVVTAAVVVQAIYAAATFHRDRLNPGVGTKVFSRPIVVVALLMVTTWAAVAYDYYDRHTSAPVSAERVVLESGVNPETWEAYVTVNVAALTQYKDGYRVMLITRIKDDSIDGMNDTGIEKSVTYAISGDELRLVAPYTGKLRVAWEKENAIQSRVYVLPLRYSPDQIKTFEDIERLGGIRVGKVEQGLGVAGPDPRSGPAGRSPRSTPPETPPDQATGTQQATP